jgi:hypothetical protein
VTESCRWACREPPGEMGATSSPPRASRSATRSISAALCRAVRHAREIRAADAGPACRPDDRCRRQARLGADALDPRAAYPPREGDQQYLHEFGLCALAFTIHLALLGEAGLTRLARAQPRAACCARRPARVGAGRRSSTPASSTNSPCACQSRRPSRRGAGGKGVLGGVPESRSIRARPSDLAICCWSRRPKPRPTKIDAFAKALAEVLR